MQGPPGSHKLQTLSREPKPLLGFKAQKARFFFFLGGGGEGGLGFRVSGFRVEEGRGLGVRGLGLRVHLL